MSNAVFDAIVDAGLRHELTWAQARRLVDQLPTEDGCRHCGGRLEPKGLPCDRAWQCVACGRLHLEGAVALDYPIPAPIHESQLDGPGPEREAARQRLRAELAVIKESAA